ncbi:hypothetical protein CWI38_0126p0050 [Hamiltosporidium tvaerminnensis]|uniref:Uncharacterized protein n=1 Tax=Hamiltosporidium tvaerminnensis TaxID=1176355 RepID=A0A4Q9M0I2_9MICR|nr:hypothetical protein CWI38_0126p0050 [Hamiltosporidium tvaerminnensis]
MKMYICLLIVLFFQTYGSFYNKFLFLRKSHKLKKEDGKYHKDLVVVFESNNRTLNREIFEAISNSRILLKDYIKIYYLKIENSSYLNTLFSKIRNKITETIKIYGCLEREIQEFIVIKTIFDEIFNLFKEDLNAVCVKYREDCKQIILELKEFLTKKFKDKIVKNPMPHFVKNNHCREISISCNDIKVKLSIYFKSFILNLLRHLFTYFGNFKIFAQEVILKNHKITYYETTNHKHLNHIFSSLKYEKLDIDTLSINFLFNCNNKNRLEDIINIAYYEISNNKSFMIEKRYVEYILFCLTDKVMNSKIEFSKNLKNTEEKYITLDKKTFPLTKEILKMYKRLDLVIVLNLEAVFLDFLKRFLHILLSKKDKKNFPFKKSIFSLRNADLNEFYCFETREKKQIFTIFNETPLRKIKNAYFNDVSTVITVFIDKFDAFLSIYFKDSQPDYKVKSSRNMEKKTKFSFYNKVFKMEFLRLIKEYLNSSNIFIRELEL